MNAQPIDLSAWPMSLEVAAQQTLAVLDTIKAHGGHVCCMARGKENGHWKLSIQWPQDLLFEREVLIRGSNR